MNEVEIREKWDPEQLIAQTVVRVNDDIVPGARIEKISKGAVTITVPTTVLRTFYEEGPSEVLPS